MRLLSRREDKFFERLSIPDEAFRKSLKGIVLVLMMAAAFAPHRLSAMTLEQLREDDMLRTSVTVDSNDGLYQRAPFVLVIEVATARWFSRGTRVEDFRIPGAVVRPVSNFADNSSRRINGETWSIQRWRFRVFPREAGILDIPPLELFASVNTATDGTVEGDLKLDPLQVEIQRPAEADDSAPWIATPDLSIEQSWEGELESYIPGDAITRKRRFVVQDAPAMMLESSKVSDIPGLSIYEAPATVSDQSDRGKLVGTREETLVVTFESPGIYHLPGLEYAWFNTDSKEFETISLPALEVEVVASTPQSTEKDKAFHFSISAPVILATIATLVIIAALWLTRGSTISLKLRAAINARRQRRANYQGYLQALRSQNSALCVQLLYGQLPQTDSTLQLREAVKATDLKRKGATAANGENGIERSLELLLEHAYGGGSLMPDQGAAIELWRALSHPSSGDPYLAELHLNPLSSTL
ncbi:hypothetical protein R0137_13775 [Congregibacter brevis]|uniref:Oxygen tolerance n=1 Tax=Congregibacter brevis TaxID=3081201 RepID=A0ABZ0IC79_9GAMM|nr:hypothetical protein R0137_13775 [Congregibacter sp. IMCC45268]